MLFTAHLGGAHSTWALGNAGFGWRVAGYWVGLPGELKHILASTQDERLTDASFPSLFFLSLFFSSDRRWSRFESSSWEDEVLLRRGRLPDCVSLFRPPFDTTMRVHFPTEIDAR